MEANLSDGEEQLVMLEFMDIVGESADRARQFLQVCEWGFVHDADVGVSLLSGLVYHVVEIGMEWQR